MTLLQASFRDGLLLYDMGPGVQAFSICRDAVLLAAGFASDLISDLGPRGPEMAGGLHIDLWKDNRRLLEEAGIKCISTTGICTYMRSDLFFSARREGTKCGRIISSIRITAGREAL